MKIWTRYNIAEPVIHKIIESFDDKWEKIDDQLKKLPTNDLAADLDWESYRGRYFEERAKYMAWTEDMRNWIQACYPQPDDRVINTGDKICQRGLEYGQVKRGEKEATEMWTKFLLPLVTAYKKRADFDQALYDESYQVFIDATYKTGEPHSFRCTYIWIRTRVRYFEIIPTWELSRIAEDTEKYFMNIENFREELLTKYGVEATGLYSEEKLNEMRAYKDEQVKFLRAWALGSDEIFDQDGELHRKTLRGLTYSIAMNAKKVENWYFMMAFNQFVWKDGHPHDFNPDNFKYKDGSIQNFVRPHARTHVRLEWRKWCWREMVKLHFHTWRRI